MNDLDRGLKVAVWDIESLDLVADWAYMVCACVKEVRKDGRGKIHTFRIDDYQDPQEDRKMLQALVECLDSFDVVAGWYSSRFDFPFLVSRCLHHGIKTPTKNFRRDLCLCARGFGKISNNRLASWGRYLLGKNSKTALFFKAKIAAIRGEKWALDYYVDHCQKDVIQTEKLYHKFMPVLGKLRR